MSNMTTTDADIHITPTLGVASQKIDDRKNKRYGRALVFTLVVFLRDWAARDLFCTGPRINGAASGAQLMREAFASLCHELSGAPDDENGLEFTTDAAFYATPVSGVEGYEYQDSYCLSVFVPADKPSEILDEAACLGRLGGLEKLTHQITTAAKDALWEAAQIAEAAEQTRIANAVLEHLTDVVRERSQKIVRYRQRLAALEAELRAEHEAQAAAVLEELEEKPLTHTSGGQELPDKSVRAAKAALLEQAKKLGAPRRSGIPSLSDGGPITLETVMGLDS